jgi:hypothetical protein
VLDGRDERLAVRLDDRDELPDLMADDLEPPEADVLEAGVTLLDADSAVP